MTIGFGVRRVFSQNVKGRQFAAFHRLKHVAHVPAAFGRDFAAPGFFEFGAQFVVFDVLKTGQAVGNRTHVAAALNIILTAQRIDAAAVAADVAGEKREIDERKDIVHRVVMFGDAQRPAKLRARGFGIRVGHLANSFGGNAGFTFSAFQRVFLDARFVRFETAGRIFDELFVHEASGNDFAAHRVGQRNVRAHIEAQPNISPLRGSWCGADRSQKAWRRGAHLSEHDGKKSDGFPARLSPKEESRPSLPFRDRNWCRLPRRRPPPDRRR